MHQAIRFEDVLPLRKGQQIRNRFFGKLAAV
jgi:hypothetical protein